MKKTISILAVILLFSIPAFAADEAQPNLKIEKVEAALYDKVIVAETGFKYGVLETLAPAGRALLSIDLTLMPEWTEELDRSRVEFKEIKLTTDSGEQAPMVGYFERYGEFRASQNSFSAYRRSDWKEKPQKQYFNAVFSVPAGAKSAELTFGAVSAKVDIPAKASAAPVAASMADVAIVEAKYVPTIDSINRVGDLEPRPKTVFDGAENLILSVKVKVTPKEGNGDDPDHFFWYTPWIGVVTDGGLYVPTFGEMFMDRVNDNVSHNLNRSSGGQFGSGEAEFFFAVPPGTKAFKLTYMTTPVAEGQATPPAAAPKPAEAPAKDQPSDKDKAKTLLKNIMDSTE